MGIIVKIKRHVFRKRTIVIVIILGTVFFVARPYIFPTSEEQLSATVKTGTIKTELTLSGEIAAEEQVTLQFQTGGLLTYVGVKEGDRVKKGQTIARLDQRSIQKNLQKALNTYKQERNEFEQGFDDNADTPIDDELGRIYDTNQLDLNNAVVDVELQDLALKLSNLSSPIDGIVTQVDSPVAGVNITAASPATFKIVNPETLFFSVTADQAELDDLERVTTGTITLDAFSDDTITGTISTISYTPKEDESGTMYEVKVGLTTPSSSITRYRLGMTGDITFVTEEKRNVLTLPSEFIKTDDNGEKYVLVGKDKKRVTITTGIEGEENIEITKGLTDGEVVYE